MVGNTGTVKIEIRVDDKGSIHVKNLRGEIDKTGKKGEKAFKRTGQSLESMNKKTMSARSAMIKLAAAAAALTALYMMIKKIVGVMSEWVQVANTQEAAEKRLGAVLKATGEAAGYNLVQLKAMASGMQEVTTVGDEVILNGMSILATFKKIRGEGFERSTQAALDMSDVMQTDLKSSIVMIGKAMNDPIANLSAMTRAGVQFTDEQREMIKTLWKAGKEMEAQAIILDELESQFSGAAKAARDIYGGAVTAAGNALGDMKEELGFVITKNKVFIELAKKAEQVFKDWGERIKENREYLMQLAKDGLLKVFDAIILIVKTLRILTAAWSAFKIACTYAAQLITESLELIYNSLMVLFKPFSLLLDWLVEIGVAGSNPFKEIQNEIKIMADVSRAATKNVIEDAVDTDEAYENTIKTLEGWRDKIAEIPVAQVEAEKEITKSVKEVGKVTDETTHEMAADWEQYIADVEKEEKEHLKFMKGVNANILKEEKQLLADRLDEQDKYMSTTEKETKEMLIEILDLTDDYFNEDTGKTTKKVKGFFDAIEEGLKEDQENWESWGYYIGTLTDDLFEDIGESFGDNVADFITGEISSIGDLWESLLDSMLDALNSFISDLVSTWAKGALKDLFSSLFDGESGTGILGSILSPITDALGLTGEGGLLSGIGDWFSGLFSSYNIGLGPGASEYAYLAGTAATTGTTGVASMGVWGGTGSYTGFTGGQYAATTTGLGTGALAGMGYMAAFAALCYGIHEMLGDTSDKSWYKTQTEHWDPIWEEMDAPQRAMQMWLGVQEGALEYEEGVRHYFAKAIALGKVNEEDLEELAKLHGESVERVTKRYNLWYENTMGLVINADRVQEINDWYDVLSEAFGNLFDYAEAAQLGGIGQLLQAAQTGERGVAEEDFFAQYSPTYGGMSDIERFEMGDIEKYGEIWNEACDAFAEKWQETLNEFTESEQDYISNMLDAWQNGVGEKTALSESFFTMMIDDYAALTEAEQAWVTQALTDYESLTTEGTDAAKAFYDANILSFEQMSSAEQEWAANMLSTWTEYYGGASALAQDFFEGSTQYTEYLTDVNGQWIGDLLSGIGEVDTTWNALTDSIDSWDPSSKSVDIFYNYHNQQSALDDIPRHAEGGIFSSPHLAWIAEGGNKEAVIPLRNGKVPVEWTGGDGSSKRTSGGVDKVIIPIKIVTPDGKELQAETVEITLDELKNRSENNEIVLYAGGVR